MEGLVHPFGLDHLLALVVSAVLGSSGVTLPYLEHAIALSVVLFGAMLVLAASLHGLGIRRGLAARNTVVLGGLGTLVGLAGLYLFSQV